MRREHVAVEKYCEEEQKKNNQGAIKENCEIKESEFEKIEKKND